MGRYRILAASVMWVCAACAGPAATGGGASGGASGDPASQGQAAGRVPTAAELPLIAEGFAARGDYLRAAQYWVRALDRGVEPARVLPRLLRVYVKDRQYRLAAQCAEDQLRIQPKAPGLRLLAGRLYEALGRPQAAIPHYDEAVRAAPRAPGAHFALAAALHRQGYDRVRADYHFRRYLALRPDGPLAGRARAGLLKQVAP